MTTIEPNRVATVIEGDVPVILTIVHGAPASALYEFPLPERVSPSLLRETNTYFLAQHTRTYGQSLFGNCWIVAARVNRSQIDFNRSKELVDGQKAFDDPIAEPYYDCFEQVMHTTIDTALANAQTGLLLDIHGCLTNEVDVFLGTINGTTVQDIGGQLFARDTLAAELHIRGWRVEPKPGGVETQFTAKPGRMIDRHNLSKRGNTFGSVQIEVSRAIRNDFEQLHRFAADLAAAIQVVLERDGS